MKRFLAFALCILTLLSCTACSSQATKDISCQDVIAAYNQAGYGVFHKEDADGIDGEVCYVRVDDTDSDEYIYFEFFDSEESAKAYAEQRQWNVLLWLFSLIYSDPQWLITKTYGNIEYEYCLGSELIKPFYTLIYGDIFSIFN